VLSCGWTERRDALTAVALTVLALTAVALTGRRLRLRQALTFEKLADFSRETNHVTRRTGPHLQVRAAAARTCR
jgi:hypothetical protein